MKKNVTKPPVSGGIRKVLQIMRTAGLAVLIIAIQAFSTVNAQGRLSGTATDIQGQPIVGVTVLIQGTTSGTITGIDGTYTLPNVPANAVIVYSMVGMISQEVAYTGQAEVNITMEEDIIGLEEVIVVGYGTVRKADLTGAVSVMDVEEMEKTSAGNVANYMMGRVSGMHVTADGEPGDNPRVRIRGFTTFGDQEPLYVIDGIPIESGVRDINPNDIASVQVLKDASAASVYGSRAANGVIIITTKEGRREQPLKVSYNGYIGRDVIWQEMPMLGREDYQNTFNASRDNYLPDAEPNAWYAGNDPDSPLYIDDVDTDWQAECLKPGYRMNHSLNLSGGGTFNTYNVSLDYYKSDGTLTGLGPEYNRYTARAKNTYEKGIVSLSTSLYYAHTDENALASTRISSISGAGRPTMIVDILCAIPTQKVQNDDGTWGTYEIPVHGQTYSMNIYAVNHDLELETLADRIIASGTAQLDFGKALKWDNMGLRYKMNVSYDKNTRKTFEWIPTFRYAAFFTNTIAKLDENAYFRTTGLIENTLNYTLNMGNHNLDLLAGQMFQEEGYYYVTGHGEQYTEPYYKELSQAAETRSSTYESHHIIASYLGRINYNYGDRYLLTATVRRDGSSRFSEDNRFGVFPSVALAWRINNESFFNVSEDIVSSLKLRGSWGQLGNESIGDYLYLGALNRNAYYNFTNIKIQGGTQVNVVATDIKWETKEMLNVGLDAILLNGRVDVSAEYYQSRSEDLLVEVSIPRTVGSLDSSPIQNAGTLENSGFEFTGTYHLTRSDFRLDVTGQFATLNNKVIELGNFGAPLYGSGSINIEGEEVGQHYGYLYDGIFQSQAEVDAAPFQTAGTASGDIKFKDISGPDGVPDGFITSDDRTTLGSGIPDVTFGLTISGGWKNFDFSMFMNGAAGFLIGSNIYRHQMHTSGGLNWREDILDFWTPTNTDTDVPRVVDTDPNDNGRGSDRPGWLQKGDFLKFNNFTLGYTIPSQVFRGAISNARVYFTAQNFYILTKYKAYNPDFTGSTTSPGWSDGSYPTPRTLLIGLNFDF